jgi:DNA repair exonuclease SbcCD nuclease subunit
MEGFSGPWVLLPGNHDAALVKSVWTRAAALNAIPANVHVCLTAEPVPIAGGKAVVLPAPLTQRHTTEDLTAWFDGHATDEGVIRIGLAHGFMQGVLAEDIDARNAIAEPRATTARLDYLALGDWHGAKQIDPRTWYSGTPEPDRWKDNGAGYALVVEVTAAGALPSVTQVATAAHRWRTEDCTLNIPSDLDQLEAVLGGLTMKDVLRLDVSGRVNLEARRRVLEAVSKAQGRARAVLVDTEDLRFEPTPEDIEALGADGYLGEVIKSLRLPEEGQDPHVARDALAILAGLLDEEKTKEAQA